MKVGFIGLGSMGQPMAHNLLRAGHELRVYNRTPQRAETLCQLGAIMAQSPAEAAQEADVLITMLADDAAVEAVLFGSNAVEGAFNALTKTGIHLSMSTISVALSKRLAETHATAGQVYLAAPVFGDQRWQHKQHFGSLQQARLSKLNAVARYLKQWDREFSMLERRLGWQIW